MTVNSRLLFFSYTGSLSVSGREPLPFFLELKVGKLESGLNTLSLPSVSFLSINAPTSLDWTSDGTRFALLYDFLRVLILDPNKTITYNKEV